MPIPTVRQVILNILNNTEHPLSQVDIADAGYLVDSSVRRECQKLERDGEIACVALNGRRPLFRPTRKIEAPVEAPTVSEVHSGDPVVSSVEVSYDGVGGTI